MGFVIKEDQWRIPGSPWENAYIESFHDKLRDECLNREIFGSLWEARVISQRLFATPVGLRPPSVTNSRDRQQHQINGRTLLLVCPAIEVRSLNPIEKMWSKVKGLLRSAEARSQSS